MYAKNVERDRADDGAEDRKEGCHSKSYGIVHITVYHSTGRVLVQGVSYLFWLTEDFPEIRKACTENAGGASADTKGVCTRDGCSKDCDQLVQCDVCDGWVHCHTACSGLPKAVMESIAAKREEMFICIECTKMGDMNGDTMDSTGSLAQLKAIEQGPKNSTLSCDTKQSTSEVIEVIRNLEPNMISVVQKAYDHKNDLQLSVLIKQFEDEKAERAKLEGIIVENNKQINRLKSENKKATTKSASTHTQHTKKTISKPAGTQTQQVWPQIEGRETRSESEVGGENEHNNRTENSGPPPVVSSDANVGTSSVHPHGPENGTANGQSNHALNELNAEPIPRPTGTTDEVNGVRRNGYVPADKHFVITSSLGKHLQSRGIGQGVRVKWISGGKIQQVNESIRGAVQSDIGAGRIE